MTDLNTKFFAILTAVGEAKQANAAALGTAWTFAQMAVGDAYGTDPIPSRTQTKLINELRRAPLNQVKVDPANASVIIAEQIIPESVGGWWVREIALYDADGDMVAVANCAPTYKPLLSQGSGRTQVIRINLIVSSTANIELKIDPSVVLATREYVDTSVSEAIAKMDFKHSVLVATTANIVLSGIQTVDGELLPVGARVLVKDQTQAKDNGIYVVPAAGAWKRAQDSDTSVEVTPGLFVSVEKGTVNGDSIWQLVTDAPIILGTTALAFEMAVGRTGVITGAYTKVTVDKYGRVVAGTNPNSLAGYGILDVYTKSQVDAALSSFTDAGLAGLSSRLRITTDGTTGQAVVTGASIFLNGPTGRGVYVAINSSVSISIAGLGGLDTGAPAPNTFYYVWAVRIDGVVSLVLSANSTAPSVVTVPATSLVSRLGTVRTGAVATILRPGLLRGKKYQCDPRPGTNFTALTSVSSVSGSIAATAVNISSEVPPTAVSVEVCIGASASGSSMAASVLPRAGSGALGVSFAIPAGATSGAKGTLVLAELVIYWVTAFTGSGTANLYIAGWEEE